MPASVSNQVADHRVADERHVANDIQNLVAYELIVEAQAIVQYAGIRDDDGVFERAAKRQALLAQHLDFVQKRKRARRSDLVDKRIGREANRSRLVAQHRMIERDAVRDLEM